MRIEVYSKTFSLTLFSILILQSCQVNKYEEIEIDSSMDDENALCDSIYNSYFKHDRLLSQLSVVDYYQLVDLNQLIWYSDSAEGDFVLKISSDSLSGPELLSANFFYQDRERRKKNPKVGMYFQENYTFKFDNKSNQVTLLASLKEEKTFDTAQLSDTVKSKLSHHFLGDSLSFSKLTRIEFMYLEPPSLGEVKSLAEDMREITAEILELLCSRFEPDDPALHYRIRKLAYLGVYVSYDWAETIEYLFENPPPPPLSGERNTKINDDILDSD